MYLKQVELSLDPAHLEDYKHYARTYFAVQARQPGAVLFELLQDTADPTKWVELAYFLTREHCRRANESAETYMVRAPAREKRFFLPNPGGGARDYELLDWAWGAGQSAAALKPGIIVYQLDVRVAPGRLVEWRNYRRNFHSIVAQTEGPLRYHTVASYTEPDRFFTFRTYPSRAAAQIHASSNPLPELQLAGKPSRDLKIYEGMPPVKPRETQAFLVMWGREGEVALSQFLDKAAPL